MEEKDQKLKKKEKCNSFPWLWKNFLVVLTNSCPPVSNFDNLPERPEQK